QRALAADDELMQPGHGRAAKTIGEHVEVVATDAAQDAGEAPLDLLAIRQHDLPAASVQGAFRRARRGALLPLGTSHRAEGGALAVGEDHIKAEDVIAGLAVNDGASAGGIITD